MARRVALPQSKIRARRRIRRVRLLIALGVLVIILFGITVGLSWIPYGRIHQITIVGAETIATSSVEQLVAEKIRGTYFFTFPKNNIFLYPKEDMLADLHAQYPTIKNVEIHAENFETIGVTLEERRASALWCGQALEMAEGCRLMDEDGFAYAPAADFSGGAYYSYYGPATSTRGFSEAQALQFLTPDQFHTLASFARALAEKLNATEISRITVEANGDARISFANGFSVVFLLKEAGTDAFERFTLSLASEPFQAHPIGDFEYIDLRFGDKLYYHLK